MPYKDPERQKVAVKKWAEANPGKVRDVKAVYLAKGSRRNTRKRWSPQEEVQVMNFEGTDTELSNKLGRSIMAIQIRRNLINNR